MMKKKYLDLSIIALFSLSLFVLSGCSGGSSDIIDSPGTNNKYTLHGFFSQDVNLTAQKLDYNHLAIQMTRDSVALSSAQLFFGASALIFGATYNISSSVYTFSNTPRSYRSSGAQIINIVDSTLYTDTISTVVLDSIWITNYPDSSIPNTNGTSMFVEWSAVSGVNGYVVAVVLTNSSYSSLGYSAYVTEQGTSTTIPPDAFRANINQTLETGWYDFYVYGYTGSPDFALSSGVLPVPFPTQLPNNISHTNLSGNFGSIVVSRKKMIQVVSN